MPGQSRSTTVLGIKPCLEDFHGSDYDPLGNHQSTPFGKFHHSPLGAIVIRMQTVHDTRRQRLEILIARHGSIAALNEALRWPRADSRLSRIKNANTRTDRDGKVFQMGDNIAREIEEALALETGWMDTPPTLAEQFGHSEPLDKMAELMAVMEPEMQYKVVRMVAALSQPAEGTNGADKH